MPQFLIEAPHTKEECLKALDTMMEDEPQFLDDSLFGCMAGDHTGYATVEASSEVEARNKLPEFLRMKAKVVEVNKITPEQIKSFHSM
jgi:hypothetical protein